MAVEIVKNLPFEDYRKREGINASILKTVHSFSLLHAKAELDGLRVVETPTLDFGKCLHSWVLEGVQDWAVKPLTYPAPADHAKVKAKDPAKRIEAGSPLPWNANADYCDKWKQEQGDKVILSTDEDARIRAMRDALYANPEIKKLLGGENEVSIFLEKDGQKRKCRLDALPEGDIVADLKSGDLVQPEIFMGNALKYGWDIQSAWNLDMCRWAGRPKKEFWFIAVESDYPYAHTILKFRDVPGSFLRLGRAKYRAALQRIKNAMASGVWAGYDSGDCENFAKDYQLKQLEQTY